MIYYCRNTSDNLAVLVCKIEFSFGKIKGAVLFLIECIQVIRRHGRHIIFVSFI